MPAQRRLPFAFVMLGLVMLMWAGNSIVGRAFRADVPPFTLAFLRWSFASLLVAPFAWRALHRDLPVLRAQWKVLLLLGITGVGGFHALLYMGLRHTTASNALLVQAAVPGVVMLLDRALFGARGLPLQKLGVALSVLGVATVVFRGDLAHLLAFRLGLGDGLILASVLVWSIYTVMLRKRPPVAAPSFLLATFVVGTLAVAPFAAGEAIAGKTIHWSSGLAGALAYLVLFPSIAAYVIFNWGTEVVGPTASGQTLTLLPIFGALLSSLLLGEQLHGYHLVGMALIVAGIALSILALRRAGKAAGAPLGRPI